MSKTLFPFPPDDYDGWTQEELENGPLNLMADIIDSLSQGPFDAERYFNEVAWELVRIAKAMDKDPLELFDDWKPEEVSLIKRAWNEQIGFV